MATRAASREGMSSPKGAGGSCKGAVNSAQRKSLILGPWGQSVVEVKEKIKRMDAIIAALRNSIVFVEGKRDKAALMSLGCTDVFTISGNLRQSCDRVASFLDKEEGARSRPGAPRVVILTDFDRRGGQLAMMARDELEARSLGVDLETRKKIGSLMRVKFFEDFRRLYDKMIEEGELNG